MNKSNQTESPSLYVFDLDRTLIRKNSSLQFFFYLVERGILSKKTTIQVGYYRLRKSFGLISVPLLHAKAFELFLAGKHRQFIARHAQDFVDREFPRLFCDRLLPKLQEIQRKKAPLMLLSSSPQFLVKRFAEKFQIPISQGSTYHYDQNGCFSGIASTMDGESKRKFVEQFCAEQSILLKNTLGFSDSFDDLPLLLQLGEVQIIRPSLRLRTFSQKRGWTLL